MDNIHIAELKPKVDWDAIVVGDYRLDHSENFFAAANKENRSLNVGKCASTPLPKFKHDFSLKEVEISSLDEVEITINKEEPIEYDSQVEVEIKEELIEHHCQEEVNIEEDLIRNSSQNEVNREIIKTPGKEISQEIETEALQEIADNVCYDQDKSPSAKPKLRLEWSVLQPASALVTAAAAQPKAYGFKDVYQSKRDLALRQREEEERRAREFHSRPMPNFKILHKRLEDVQVVHHITVPKTPDTLKTWYAGVERRKEKAQLEQGQQEQIKPPRRLAQHHQGSQPLPPSQVDAKKSYPIIVKPFNLRSDQRVRDRREYDASVQIGHEQKKKEQEEQRKQRELEEIKMIRKMTEFKARPNPFK